jgi:hypothetical protein
MEDRVSYCGNCGREIEYGMHFCASCELLESW